MASVREATEGECPAGGSVLEIGVGDELEETVICNGEDGTDGEQGPQGDPGETGATGATGPAGEAGAPGDASRIIAGIYCEGGLENTTLGFTYRAMQFGSGDVFASGSVFGTIDESTSSRFYTPTQLGYETAPVVFTFDVDGTADGGYFTISLDRESLITTIAYRESLGLEEDSSTWAMDPENCILNTY